MSKCQSDEELERLAKQELLRDAKRGAERASTIGTQGWLKPKLPPTNKRFLYRTLKSASINFRHSNKDLISKKSAQLLTASTSTTKSSRELNVSPKKQRDFDDNSDKLNRESKRKKGSDKEIIILDSKRKKTDITDDDCDADIAGSGIEIVKEIPKKKKRCRRIPTCYNCRGKGHLAAKCKKVIDSESRDLQVL